VRRDQHLPAHGTDLQDGFAVHHRRQALLLALDGALHDAVQFPAAGISHQNLHEEAVKLGLRQRIGALHLDGILRGHHQERRLQLVRGRTAGHGPFLHGFQQGGLRFGSGAVDFVGQHEVGEDRSGLEAQSFMSTFIRLDHHAADDIRRHEIWRKLYPGILKLQGARQRTQQRGLSEARNPFQQHVPGRQQADEHAFDHVILPDNDLGNLLPDRVQPLDGELELRFSSHASHCRADGRWGTASGS